MKSNRLLGVLAFIFAAGTVGLITNSAMQPQVASAGGIISRGPTGPTGTGTAGPTGATGVTNTAISNLEYFGSGADGPLSVSSGSTVIVRDMYYTTGSISGTAVVETRSYALHFSSTLTLDSCPIGGVINTSTSLTGGNAVTSTGGAAPPTLTSVGPWITGTAGVGGGNQSTNGSNAAGTTSTYSASFASCGAGGANEAGTIGGTAGTTSIITNLSTVLPLVSFAPSVTTPALYITSGRGCSAGGGRAGTVSGIGGGGGGGTTGAGGIAIFAQTIHRDTTTGAGCITSNGGNGGNGANGTTVAGQGGGGGGAGGGVGGLIYIVYASLTGNSKSGAIVANGGNGGNGGNAGGASAVAGGSGAGANGGTVYIWDIGAGSVAVTNGSSGNPGTTGVTGGTGPVGGTGGTLSVAL